VTPTGFPGSDRPAGQYLAEQHLWAAYVGLLTRVPAIHDAVKAYYGRTPATPTELSRFAQALAGNPALPPGKLRRQSKLAGFFPQVLERPKKSEASPWKELDLKGMFSQTLDLFKGPKPSEPDPWGRLGVYLLLTLHNLDRGRIDYAQQSARLLPIAAETSNTPSGKAIPYQYAVFPKQLLARLSASLRADRKNGQRGVKR